VLSTTFKSLGFPAGSPASPTPFLRGSHGFLVQSAHDFGD
jgi:hypothetical protein